MTYLKIENNGRGPAYAKALIGSETMHGYASTLVGVSADRNYPFVCKGSLSIDVSHVIIPLDKLQLCPFVAMREGISVLAYNLDHCEHGSGGETLYFTFTGVILNMDEDGCFCLDSEEFYDDETISKYTLDITPIEAGEVEGVSIVEVEE